MNSEYFVRVSVLSVRSLNAWRSSFLYKSINVVEFLFQGPIPAYVEKVMLTCDGNESTLLKLLLRQTR